MKAENQALAQLLDAQPEAFVAEWLREAGIEGADPRRGDALRLLPALRAAVRADADPARMDAPAWAELQGLLAELSASRAAQGEPAGETRRFVLAMKRPIFAAVQGQQHADPTRLVASLWWASSLIDRLAQYTVDTYQRAREEIISRQQQELLELSTPVVKLWDGVLAVPMIGTLDSSRTQLVMEALLQRIVEVGAELAIIDITGVPTVDTLVAQHLLKTVTAIRLMGADCIISGIRPQIAQTIVHLGIDLQGVTTKSTLADALSLALRRTGYVVTRTAAGARAV